MMLFCASGAE